MGLVHRLVSLGVKVCQTPIQIATEKRNPEIALLLLANGAEMGVVETDKVMEALLERIDMGG